MLTKEQVQKTLQQFFDYWNAYVAATERMQAKVDELKEWVDFMDDCEESGFEIIQALRRENATLRAVAALSRNLVDFINNALQEAEL